MNNSGGHSLLWFKNLKVQIYNLGHYKEAGQIFHFGSQESASSGSARWGALTSASVKGGDAVGFTRRREDAKGVM
jgi:hypothetical protein